MNNWRLLLLAVIAALQPIGSFTEPNLIDGREECCDHRSNSITQETRLYGSNRKTTPEERRLSTREDIREERRYEARNDPVTRSKQRLTLERAERRISFVPAVRFSTKTRFERDQERRNRISVDARKSRQTREHQDRRTREIVFRDSTSQYERDVLDSRRTRMSRDYTRTERIGNERLYKESADSRDARNQNSEDHRRVLANRETMAILSRERDDVARGVVRRDSRVNIFRSVSKVQLDNNERRTLERRARDSTEENRRSLSLDSRVNRINEREDLRSRTDLREDRRSNFGVISERIDERRRGIRESRDRTSAVRRDSSERISVDHQRESRVSDERVDRTGRNIRENNERIDERRQQRDESRPSRERMTLRESIHRTSAERRQPLTRESRILNANVRSERIARSSDEMKIDERIETSKDMLRAPRDSTAERRQDSRISRILEATTRNERFMRSDERNERRQSSTRSLDRVSRDSRSIERENNFRDSTRFSEREVRDERPARYRRDVRSAETLEERRQQRDESIISRDRTISTLRESRDSAERRQESRTTENVSRFEVRARSERESRIREDLQDNTRFDVNRREREERRASWDHTLHRMARDNERNHDREMFKDSRFAERALSNKRDARLREDARSDRIRGHREIRDENRASRDRPVVMQRLTRAISATPQRHNTLRTSRNDETHARIQRTRIFENDRNERREVRERDENRASHDRISMIRESRENIEEQRREARGTTKNSRVDIRNEVTRNRDVRMGDRLEIRRQENQRSSQTRDILTVRSVERRSQEVTSRDAEMNNQSKRLSRSRDERRINGLEVRNHRDVKALESRRESRRMTEKEIQPNRNNLAMDRMERTPNRAIRDVRIEAKLRTSEIVLGKDVRTDTRRVTIESRFRNFETKVRELDSVDETSHNQNTLNWQMIFYSLQGAYLCSLLMQMLTEKSYKGKSRLPPTISPGADVVKGYKPKRTGDHGFLYENTPELIVVVFFL